MSYSLQFRDRVDGLRITVNHTTTLRGSVVAGVLSATILGGLGGLVLPGRWWIVLAVCGGMVGMLAEFFPDGAELNATGIEFHTRRNFGPAPRSASVPAAAIRAFAHHNAEGGETSDFEPEGLFAETQFGSVSLLPFVDAEGSQRVVVALEQKFPALKELWQAPSPFDEHFLTLETKKAK